jgi:hypothetical protein
MVNVSDYSRKFSVVAKYWTQAINQRKSIDGAQINLNLCHGKKPAATLIRIWCTSLHSTVVKGYSHNVVISPQNTIIVEVNCGVEPKMEALLPAHASAAVCIYVSLNHIWLACSNSKKFHIDLVMIGRIIPSIGSL